jgi:hypothetical protein
MSRLRSAVLVGVVVISSAVAARAQTSLGCTSGGAGGAIPTTGTGGGGTYPTVLPPAELVSVLAVPAVPAGATAVTGIELRGLSHTWAGDLMLTLEDPSGAVHLLINQVGGSCDFLGDYTITGLNGGGPLPACSGTSLPSGASFDQSFNSWPSGTHGIGSDDLSGVAPQTGNWTLRVYDWALNDIGSLASWDICFGTPPPPPPPPPCDELSTIYASNNGGSVGGQVFFDLAVLAPGGLSFEALDVNTGLASGGAFSLEVYARAGTYAGSENNPAAWTLVGNGNGVSAGLDQASFVDVSDFALPAGSHGVALVLIGAAHRYTSGTGGNQNYANSHLALAAGAALNVPWTGPPFTPRVFNGTLRYACPVSTPIAYCTAGTTSNGCVPSISASDQPSATQANPCTITVVSVEGGRSGLLFYGVDDSGFTPTPWGSGGTSYLCVKAPTQRTTTQPTGGLAGTCGGQLVLDWNAYQSANPGALGNPWAAGSKAYVQGWFRDPPAVKTTNLSNAIELTLVP